MNTTNETAPDANVKEPGPLKVYAHSFSQTVKATVTILARSEEEAKAQFDLMVEGAYLGLDSENLEEVLSNGLPTFGEITVDEIIKGECNATDDDPKEHYDYVDEASTEEALADPEADDVEDARQ